MSTNLLRLFVAARIPDDRLAQLNELAAPLRDKLTNARWTEPASQHLTLKFLGPTPADRIEAVTKTTAMVAGGHKAARMSLTGLDAFPSRSRIRVLWLGVEDAGGLLAGCAADLDRAFEPLGVPSEGRAYTPHLTMARFKIAVPLRSGFPEIDTSSIEGFEIDELVLFRSHLSPKGARYEVLDTFPLGSSR